MITQLVFVDMPRKQRRGLRQLIKLRRRFNGRCFYCRVPMTLPGEPRSSKHTRITREHLIPRSKGGRSNSDNIVAACFRCNIRKGNGSWLDFYCRIRLEQANLIGPSLSLAPVDIYLRKGSTKACATSGRPSPTDKTQTVSPRALPTTFTAPDTTPQPSPQ
jgi:hypothetical protein